MTPPGNPQRATRDSAVMSLCLVLVIAATGYASHGWALLISFDGMPSDDAAGGLRTLTIVAVALAVIAAIDGLVGRSWSSAGIVGAHAALTFLHPNLWLVSALPTIIALLILVVLRLRSVPTMRQVPPGI